jgi:hypothetical protein
MGERKDKATSSKWSFIETDNGFMIILAKPAVSSSFSQSPPVFVAKIAKLSEEGEVVESPHQPFELLPESNFVPPPVMTFKFKRRNHVIYVIFFKVIEFFV